MGVDGDLFLMSRASGAPLRELRSVNKMLADGCLIGPCCCCCPFWSFPNDKNGILEYMFLFTTYIYIF